jgi:hypothetical protein
MTGWPCVIPPLRFCYVRLEDIVIIVYLEIYVG